VVAIQVYALGHVSGAHFNPAITIGLASARRFPWKKVPGYVAAQLFGATLAGFLLVMIFGSAADATTTHETVPVHIAILVEVLATFLLAFVISAVATDRRAPVSVGGLSIGFAVAADSLAFGGLTGASMNPARSMGPALAVGDLVGLWLYVVAPLAGAILGAWSYEFCRGRSSDADFEAAYTSKPGQDQSPDAGFD
jgi:aquaporin NIP